MFREILNPMVTNAIKETDLDAYIAGVKHLGAIGGTETALGAVEYEALYGIGYYEANKYGSVETSFSLSLHRDDTNPYINYLMAVSMAPQAKKRAAKPYLQKAFVKDPNLLQRFEKDVAKATANWQKMVESTKIKVLRLAKPTFGGTLVPGNYTCHQSLWNGHNKSPAYSLQYKGYFALKFNGSYR